MRPPFLRFLGCWLVGLWALAPLSGPAGQTNNPVIAPHARDLVVLQGNQLVPFRSDQLLKAPYIMLYFGAGWCPDCRRFSPTLVKAYDRQPDGNKGFEVLLLTKDKTAQDLLTFMRTEKMKWPALAFDKMAGAEDLKKYDSGRGIPCLSVIDQQGTLVLQSRSDQDAADILKQLEDLLKSRR